MRNINSQQEYNTWVQKHTRGNPSDTPENDEHACLRAAFSPGLIAARKKHGGYDTLTTKEQLRVLRDVAEQEWIENKYRIA